MDITEHMPEERGDLTTCPALMREKELIKFLRIPELTTAKDYSNVIANLRRMHDLPCIHICRQPLYPREAVLQWISDMVEKELKK